jgi:hypothetical protein
MVRVKRLTEFDRKYLRTQDTNVSIMIVLSLTVSSIQNIQVGLKAAADDRDHLGLLVFENLL